MVETCSSDWVMLSFLITALVMLVKKGYYLLMAKNSISYLSFSLFWTNTDVVQIELE